MAIPTKAPSLPRPDSFTVPCVLQVPTNGLLELEREFFIMRKVISVVYWLALLSVYAAAIAYNPVLGLSVCILHALASIAHRQERGIK